MRPWRRETAGESSARSAEAGGAIGFPPAVFSVLKYFLIATGAVVTLAYGCMLIFVFSMHGSNAFSETLQASRATMARLHAQLGAALGDAAENASNQCRNRYAQWTQLLSAYVAILHEYFALLSNHVLELGALVSFQRFRQPAAVRAPSPPSPAPQLSASEKPPESANAGTQEELKVEPSRRVISLRPKPHRDSAAATRRDRALGLRAMLRGQSSTLIQSSNVDSMQGSSPEDQCRCYYCCRLASADV
jgi:hypothetical protein